jgi:hypothetical protein
LVISRSIEQIGATILKLPSDEFQQLLKWFFDLHYQPWDEQMLVLLRQIQQ